MRFALLLSILFPAIARAQWSTPDKLLVGAGAAALIADYSTTEWAVIRHGWKETNPLIGSHPSSAWLTDYTAAHLALYVIANAKLPPHARRVFDVTFFAIETYALTGNLIAGAQFFLP